MLNFAHEDVVHANEAEAAIHNWPLLVISSLVVFALLAFCYLLLMNKPEQQEQIGGDE